MNRFAAFCLGVLGTCVGLQAQELTLSPYSRYAIGDILSNATTRNAAMGGIGVASDNYFSVNRINPAGYADMIFTTMDVSIFGQYSSLRTENSTDGQLTGGLQNVAFAFPSNKGLVLTMGFSPYSAVGYQIRDLEQVTLDDTTVTQETQYRGEGGVNQAFIGAAFKLLKRRLRVGANFQFLFGNTQYQWQNRLLRPDTASTLGGYQPISITEDVYLRGLSGQIGLIYEDTLNASTRTLFRVGASLERTINMWGDRFVTFSNLLLSDTLRSQERGDVDLPQKIGLGFMINRPGSWSLGADVSFQNWDNFNFLGDEPTLGKEIQVAVGGEITPSFESAKFLARTNYRLGAYWRQTYIEVAGQSVQDYGVTLGFGLPAGLKGSSRFDQGRAVSRINFSAELGRRGNLNSGLPLEELYARLRLGITLNDRWFVRRVVD